MKRVGLLLLILFSCSLTYHRFWLHFHRKTIYLKPFDSSIFNKETLFNKEDPTRCFVCRSGLSDLKAALLSKKSKLKICSNRVKMKKKNVDDIVVFDFHETSSGMVRKRSGKFLHGHSVNRVLFLFEPIHVLPENYHPQNHKKFDKVFTWCDDLVDNKKYYKFYWPQPSLHMQSARPFCEKKLCVMIASNNQFPHPHTLMEERREAALFFSRSSDFDLFGKGWESEGLTVEPVPLTCASELTLGHQSKIDCLKNYRFSLCYENLTGVRGYITEKIFDCFIAGCVPVYWGAVNIEEYIPASCFLLH